MALYGGLDGATNLDCDPLWLLCAFSWASFLFVVQRRQGDAAADSCRMCCTIGTVRGGGVFGRAAEAEKQTKRDGCEQHGSNNRQASKQKRQGKRKRHDERQQTDDEEFSEQRPTETSQEKERERAGRLGGFVCFGASGYYYVRRLFARITSGPSELCLALTARGGG